MKKTYMKPTMKVVKIQQQNIICASPYGVQDTLQSTTVTSAWSREGFWDDEDE